MIKECILAFLACGIFSSIATAADVEVRARLSDSTTSVSTPVRLEIVVQGARSAEVSRNWAVDGLQVRYVGESMGFQMVNFRVSTSSSYTFMILPLRAGNFTIPSLEVKVDDKTFRTQPMRLTVYGPGNDQNNSGLQTSSQSSPPAPLPIPTATPQSAHHDHAIDGQAGKLAFGVLIVPKKQIYVGEVVPVEIRYYFRSDLPVREVGPEPPSLIGDDFVVQRDPKHQQGSQFINGVKYGFLSFRNSIRPLKAGELKLPATSISCQVLVQARPEPPPGMDLFFQQFLESMSGVVRIQQMEFGSEPVVVHVKPLPEENKPDSFHGAIGQFSLHTEVSPRDPSPGDPVTLRGIISGEGNFDEMGTPDLVSKEGWQSYPPSSKFAGSDDIGYAGKKTFEWMLIPKEKKSNTPALEFSYFNTVLNKYVTLHGHPLSVNAVPLGSGAPSITPMPLPASAANPSIPSVGRDKFRIARKLRSESFRPVTARTPFVVANGVALLALLIFLGYQLIRCHAASDRGRKAALRRSLGACRARASTSQGKDFYSSVVECLRLQAQIIFGKDTSGYSGDEVVATLGLKGEEAALVLKVFARYEESAYGGAQSALSAETRAAVLMLLNHRK